MTSRVLEATVKLSTWNDLGTAAAWLSERTGETWSVRDVVAAIEQVKAPALVAYGSVPSGALSSVSKIVRTSDGLESYERAPAMSIDALRLGYAHAHALLLGRPARIGRFHFDDAEYFDHVGFDVGLEHIRIRKQDLVAFLCELNPALKAHEEMPWEAPGLAKRERQIRAIEFHVDACKFERMSIPDGGKKDIEQRCKEHHKNLFGVGGDPFKDAWQEAVRQGRIRMTLHVQYSKR